MSDFKRFAEEKIEDEALVEGFKDLLNPDAYKKTITDFINKIIADFNAKIESWSMSHNDPEMNAASKRVMEFFKMSVNRYADMLGIVIEEVKNPFDSKSGKDVEKYKNQTTDAEELYKKIRSGEIE